MRSTLPLYDNRARNAPVHQLGIKVLVPLSPTNISHIGPGVKPFGKKGLKTDL